MMGQPGFFDLQHRYEDLEAKSERPPEHQISGTLSRHARKIPTLRRNLDCSRWPSQQARRAKSDEFYTVLSRAASIQNMPQTTVRGSSLEFELRKNTPRIFPDKQDCNHCVKKF